MCRQLAPVILLPLNNKMISIDETLSGYSAGMEREVP